MPRHRLLVAVLALLPASCSEPAAPEFRAPLGPRVVVELHHPAQGVPGQPVRFQVQAFNTTGGPVRISEMCGPPVDVLIYRGSAIVGRIVGFEHTTICAPAPDQYVPAGETLTMELTWTASEEPGVLWAVAGGRGQYGLLYPSRSSRLEIR